MDLEALASFHRLIAEMIGVDVRREDINLSAYFLYWRVEGDRVYQGIRLDENPSAAAIRVGHNLVRSVLF